MSKKSKEVTAIKRDISLFYEMIKKVFPYWQYVSGYEPELIDNEKTIICTVFYSDGSYVIVSFNRMKRTFQAGGHNMTETIHNHFEKTLNYTLKEYLITKELKKGKV